MKSGLANCTGRRERHRLVLRQSQVSASPLQPDPTHFGVEEDLGSQEALVAHVDGELLLADGVDAGVLLDPLGAVRVVLVELLDQVGTHVAEALLTEEKRRESMRDGERGRERDGRREGGGER